jgi:hypothetical protein
MHSLFRALLPGLLLVALAACGNDDDSAAAPSPANGADDSPPAADATPPADTDADDGGPSLPGGSGGEGSLTVDGVTYSFAILECGPDPATRMDNVSFGLTGRGETAEGEQFTVDVTAAELSEDMDSQSISLWLGDGFAPEVVYQSMRLQMGDNVTGTGDTNVAESGLDWPLFEYGGGVIRVEAGFSVEAEGVDDLEHAGMGVFEANCE